MAKDAAEALGRAVNNQSTMNYQTIIDGFIAKGIAGGDITPRENVFTYEAWKALGRQVRKGEHGVKVQTFVPMTKKEQGENGEETKASFKRPKTTTVFHISQTDPIEAEAVAA